jgi:hypothetical protein
MLFVEKSAAFDADALRAVAPNFGLAKVDLQLIETSNRKGAKAARIEKVETAMSAGRLFLCVWQRGYREMREQLSAWPNVSHDDWCDVLGLMCEAPTGWASENPLRPPQPPNQMDWIRALNNSEPVQDSYIDRGCGTGINCG